MRVKERKTAIKGIFKQYGINGVEKVDARSFLSAMARKQAMKLFNKNRMIRVNLVSLLRDGARRYVERGSDKDSCAICLKDRSCIAIN